MDGFRCASTAIRRYLMLFALGLMLATPLGHAQAPADGAAPVEAWFYLGRQSETGAWAPQTGALRLDSAKNPKQVTVLRDVVLVDNINPDPAAENVDAEASAWTRVVRRGPGAIALLELVRQDSIGNGKLVWGKVRVPGERVEVMQRR